MTDDMRPMLRMRIEETEGRALQIHEKIRAIEETRKQLQQELDSLSMQYNAFKGALHAEELRIANITDSDQSIYSFRPAGNAQEAISELLRDNPEITKEQIYENLLSRKFNFGDRSPKRVIHIAYENVRKGKGVKNGNGFTTKS